MTRGQRLDRVNKREFINKSQRINKSKGMVHINHTLHICDLTLI